MFFSIQKGKLFWQCGMWVNVIYNATKYRSEDEAHAAMAMRGIHNGIVVPNNEEWRDLRPKVIMKNETLTEEELDHGLL